MASQSREVGERLFLCESGRQAGLFLVKGGRSWYPGNLFLLESRVWG